MAERVWSCVVEAHLNEGRVPPGASPPPRTLSRRPGQTHWIRPGPPRLETLSGDLAAANAGFEAMGDLTSLSLCTGAMSAFSPLPSACCGGAEPERALGHLTVVLEVTLTTSSDSSTAACWRARPGPSVTSGIAPPTRRLLELRAAAHVDPFDQHRGPGDAYAHGLTWDAESPASTRRRR